MLSFPRLCALVAALSPTAACAADPPALTETVIPLTLYPQAAPIPALRYALLPELTEISPGIVVQNYLKCFSEQNHFFFNKESIADREKWQVMPLKELPDLKEYGGNALRQADYAARLETVDWQILAKLKVEGAFTLLPEVQQLRWLAAALKVRYRGEIKDLRFADAIRTHKTMFAMARQLQEHPTLISHLVGIAIASITLSPMEELIQQPGAPNLYWAISNLPTPLVDIRKGIQAERLMVTADLTRILETDEPASDEKLQEYREKFRVIHAMFEPNGMENVNGAEWLKERADTPAVVKAARDRLKVAGIAEKKLSRWSPLQLIIRDEYLRYEIQRDEIVKWVNFTDPQVLAEGIRRGEEVNKSIRAMKVDPRDPEASLMIRWAPMITKVHLSQIRLQQRLALLQNIEAIRIYTAEHDNKFPGKPESISLPLLPDPFTGKAFIYRVEETKATLQGTPPPGMEKIAAYNVRYELTLKK